MKKILLTIAGLSMLLSATACLPPKESNYDNKISLEDLKKIGDKPFDQVDASNQETVASAFLKIVTTENDMVNLMRLSVMDQNWLKLARADKKKCQQDIKEQNLPKNVQRYKDFIIPIISKIKNNGVKINNFLLNSKVNVYRFSLLSNKALDIYKAMESNICGAGNNGKNVRAEACKPYSDDEKEVEKAFKLLEKFRNFAERLSEAPEGIEGNGVDLGDHGGEEYMGGDNYFGGKGHVNYGNDNEGLGMNGGDWPPQGFPNGENGEQGQWGGHQNFFPLMPNPGFNQNFGGKNQFQPMPPQQGQMNFQPPQFPVGNQNFGENNWPRFQPQQGGLNNQQEFPLDD